MRQETFGQSERPGEQVNSQHAETVMTVLEESVAIFFRLRAALEDIHGHSEISGSMRGVMRDLNTNGPLTVPQMARRRPVSRQHIQAIVNDLQRAGFVSLTENPRHKRSKIVELTPVGKAALDKIITREHAVLKEMDIPVSLDELQHTHATMVKLRKMMESRTWRDTVRSVLYKGGEAPENPWIDENDEFQESSPEEIHRN
jgi:DNA-binding MarR family transcriptional regulator